jgi:hypothetical protein
MVVLRGVDDVTDTAAVAGAGSALGFLARNKTVQKKTGSMIAKKAQDEELQKKVLTQASPPPEYAQTKPYRVVCRVGRWRTGW